MTTAQLDGAERKLRVRLPADHREFLQGQDGLEEYLPMDLRDLERRRLAAVVSGDRAVLAELHAPDFLLCTPSGTVWSRQRYIDGLVDGSIRYQQFEPVTPIEVVADAELAVLRYRSEIRISVDGGPVGRLACWHLDVYQRDGARWRCRWSQATDTITD